MPLVRRTLAHCIAASSDWTRSYEPMAVAVCKLPHYLDCAAIYYRQPKQNGTEGKMHDRGEREKTCARWCHTLLLLRQAAVGVIGQELFIGHWLWFATDSRSSM